MIRIVKVNFKPTLFLLILTFFAVGCTKLEKVEGCKVTDIVSGQVIEGVRVIANASSNLKSEQKYLHFETMTDRNGKFNIKGLPGKNYSLALEKDGYQSKKYISIRISEEGTKICQLEIELYPNLPNSDVEYNIYDPYSKKIVKKIDYMKRADYQNNGYGDVHYFYDKKLVENISQVECPRFLLRVGYDNGMCRTHNISKLKISQDMYEIALKDKNSFMIAKMDLLYSYREGSLIKELYRYPDVSTGFYQLGHRLDCSGVDYILNVK